MIYATDFGQFISEKRNEFSLTATELAQRLGISIGYLCQLEHSKRGNPDTTLLKKLIAVFELDKNEIAYMYDLYAKASGAFYPDISEYVLSRDVVKKALRYAIDIGATNEDWEKFIEFLSQK